MTPTPAQRDALTRIADEFAGLAHQIRVLTQPETPAQDAHTPRTAPQTRSGGTESGEGGGGAQKGSLGDRLRAHAERFRGWVSNDDPANDEDIELSGHHFWVTVQGINAMAARAEWLTYERDQARAQVEAVRAAIEREAAHGDAVTRCNLVAERFRTVLDGASSKAGGNGEVGV